MSLTYSTELTTADEFIVSGLADGTVITVDGSEDFGGTYSPDNTQLIADIVDPGEYEVVVSRWPYLDETFVLVVEA